MKINKPRLIVWFSCGGPSAVAAKLSLEMYSETHTVLIVNCDTRPSEHEDNYRFSKEVENWIGQKIIYIRNDKYLTVDDVFEKERFMSSPFGAKCTTLLKKKPRQLFQIPDDFHVFGFTYEERGKRKWDFANRNPELKLLWPLIERGFTRRRCLNMIRSAGIEEPIMYQLGFRNNNCPGCVKAQSPWYWDKIRTHFPEVFKRRCEQSRALGVRLVKWKGKRIFLDELPPTELIVNYGKNENVSCGPECASPGIGFKL